MFKKKAVIQMNFESSEHLEACGEAKKWYSMELLSLIFFPTIFQSISWTIRTYESVTITKNSINFESNQYQETENMRHQLIYVFSFFDDLIFIALSKSQVRFEDWRKKRSQR